MKFLSGFVSLAILSATIVSSSPITRRDVNEALVPQFGFSAGVNPTGTGDCDGAVNGTDGQPVKIPCSCPPDRATFIQSLNANVAAGHVVNNTPVPISFPEDNSTASQLARINAATVTLQNLNGSGQGCPDASTTFQAQAAAINITRPQVVEAILMARQLSSALSPVPAILKARQLSSSLLSPSPVPTLDVTGPHVVGAILKARQLSSLSSPSPIPTLSVTGPHVVGAILKARQLSSLSSPSPIPTLNVTGPHVVGAILKARQLSSSPSPTPTVSGIDPLGDILTASDSESAPSQSSTPTFSLRIVEHILARQSTPSPSPVPEIIVTGPPPIEDIL